MTPRLSSVKKDSISNLFFCTLERSRAPLLFYSILMALLGPVSLLVQFLAGAQTQAMLPDLLAWGLPLGVALLMPLLIFHYVNNKQALDVFHAAPVRRETLYSGGYLAGLAVVLGPLLLFGGLSVLVRQLCFQNGLLALLVLLNTAVSAFASYSMMVFVMINCGTMFESIVYYLALNAGYPVVVNSLFQLMQQHTYGYLRTAESAESLLFSISPYYLLTRSESWSDFRLLPLLMPLLMGLALTFLGKLLYRRRKSESAGQSFAYRPLFFVGAGLACLGAGLAFLVLLSGDGEIRFGTVLTANLVGIVAYVILDTIRNRGFREIRVTAVTACGIALGVSGLMGLGALTGTFGYEKRVPLLEDIVSVQIEMPVSLSDNTAYALGNAQQITLKDPENIKLVLDFHQAMAAERDPIQEYRRGVAGKYVTLDCNGTPMLHLLDGYDRYSFDNGRYPQSDYGSGGAVTLTYQLKNGRSMARLYADYPFVLTKPLYRLIQAEEYRAACYEQQLSMFHSEGGVLEISSIPYNGYTSLSMDAEQVALLRDAIRKDVEERPADFLASPNGIPLYRFSMRIWQPEDAFWNYTTGSFWIYDKDDDTLTLLRRWHAIPKIRTDAYEGTVAGYIPQEKMDAAASYSQRDLGIFYHAGRFALQTEYSQTYQKDPYGSMTDSYRPRFVTLTSEQYMRLMKMITQVRFSETGGDVVVIGSISYLVFPEYEEEVRAMMLSSAEYVPNP